MIVRGMTIPGTTPNEDVWGFAGAFAWVIDGATGVGDTEVTGGHYANRLHLALRSAIDSLSSRGRKPALAEILSSAIEVVSADLPAHSTASASVALVRAQRSWVDYLVLGDCSVSALGDRPLHVTDQRLDSVARGERARFLRLRRDLGPDDIRTLRAHRKLVEQERAARNQHDGYWIAAYDPVAPFHARTGRLPHRTVLLATDGCPIKNLRFPALNEEPDLEDMIHQCAPVNESSYRDDATLVVARP